MPSETVQTTDLARAEARLPRWMMGCAFAVTLTVLSRGHVRLAAGFVTGAALAMLNYYWLHQAVENVFIAGHARVPKRAAIKFALRYPLAFAGVYFFYRTGWLPWAAILAGLFVPVAGVLIEAVFQIREGLRRI